MVVSTIFITFLLKCCEHPLVRPLCTGAKERMQKFRKKLHFQTDLTISLMWATNNAHFIWDADLLPDWVSMNLDLNLANLYDEFGSNATVWSMSNATVCLHSVRTKKHTVLREFCLKKVQFWNIGKEYVWNTFFKMPNVLSTLCPIFLHGTIVTTIIEASA